MRRSRLKLLRAAAALVVFVGLTSAFADFRNLVPVAVGHWLAGIQFVPSLVALATGAAFSLAGVMIVAATLAVGRVYCSMVCPLGILQDVIARFSSWAHRREKKFVPYARPMTWLRQGFLWGTVAGVAAGWSGLTLALLDPYSNFGRMIVGLFRPLLTLANNSVVGLANAAGLSSIYRVEAHWAGVGALIIPALMFALIAALAVWRGRLYCNTVCPVGTLLGWFAQRAAFRLEIDRGACHKCVACLNVCKSQCINLRTGTIDFSRCVACFNCIGACEHGGINYRLAWRRTAGRAAPATVGRTLPDPQRRAFLTGTATALAVSLGAGLRLSAQDPTAPEPARSGQNDGGTDPDDHTKAICPPGASSIDRFLDRCTACQLCLSACPTQVLKPALLEYGLAGLLKPRLEYSAAFCNFECRRCGEVCPDGAISLLELADKQLTQIGEAHFDRKKCIVVVKGTDCAACSEHCPTKAVHTIPYGDNLRLPEVTRDLCIGCGACEYACPVQPEKAIVVAGHRRHGRARKPVETKAAAPTPAGDFPF